MYRNFFSPVFDIPNAKINFPLIINLSIISFKYSNRDFPNHSYRNDIFHVIS